MTNEIMHYILSDKDNVVINGKISEIVGQLPVRMLKDRFFEHIRDAFTCIMVLERIRQMISITL